MSTFYNYILRECSDTNKVLDLKFQSWEGSAGGVGGLDIGEIWYVENTLDYSVNGCYLIVDRYLGDTYDGDVYNGNESILEFDADEFVFTLYEDCNECLSIYGRPTPTPTPSRDEIIERFIPTTTYLSYFANCEGIESSFYINADYYSSISGDTSTYYHEFNGDCYRLISVFTDVEYGEETPYIGVADMSTIDCCPEPTPQPSSTPLPDYGFEYDGTPCYLYEVTNNGTTEGTFDYIECEAETTTTLTLQPQSSVFVCSESVPTYNNIGFENFYIVKNNFVIGSGGVAVGLIDYDSTDGEAADFIIPNINAGRLTFTQTGNEPTNITFVIEGVIDCNPVIGGCGDIDVRIYVEGGGIDDNIITIPINANGTTNVYETYTINNIEYDKYHMLFVSANPAITYNTLKFGVLSDGSYIDITHENLGACNDPIECGTFEVNYSSDYGCGENSTYNLNITNIGQFGGPYKFSLNVSSLTQTSNGEDIIFSGLTPGTIYVTFQDLSGYCDEEIRTIVIPSNSTPTLSSEFITNPDCFDCDGVIRLNYNGFGSTVSVTVYSGFTGNPNTLFNTYTGITDNYFDVTGLCGAVNYKFIVESPGGCSAQIIRTIPSDTSITPMYVSKVVDSNCGVNDSITVSVQNNGVYVTYFAQSNEDYFEFTTTDSSYTFYDIPSGDYTVGITTSEGCTLNIGTHTILNEDLYTIRIINQTDSGCDGNEGSFELSIIDGIAQVQYPIDVLITHLYNSSTFYQSIDTYSGTHQVNNLISGTYQIVVTDANGCQQVENVTIQEGGSLDFSVFTTNCEGGDNGTAEVIINSNDGAYNILWSNGETTEQISNLASGSYDVTVTDDNCTYTKYFTITCIGGVTISGTKQSVICENNFNTQSTTVTSFDILTNFAIHQQYPTTLENCNYIPTYIANLNITNIDGSSDILISETVYVGSNIEDTLTNEVWVNGLNNLLGTLSSNYTFIENAFVNNSNEMVIIGVSGNNQMDNSNIQLSINIDIEEQC